MQTLEQIAPLALFAAAVVLIAGAATRLLRSAGAPGGPASAAILAGILVGTLAGATTMGRLTPGVIERALLGGAGERAELAELETRHALEIATLREIDVTEIAIEEHIAAYERVSAPMRDALEAAERRHAERVGVALATLAGVWLTLGALGSVRGERKHKSLRNKPAPPWDGRPARLQTQQQSDGRPARLRPLLQGPTVGLAAAAIPAGVVFLLTRWTTTVTVVEAAAFAASLAVGSMVFDIPGGAGDRRRRDRSIDLAARSALVIPACALAAIVPSAPTLLLALFAALAALTPRRLSASRAVRRACRSVALGVMLPGFVALAAATIDFITIATLARFWVAFVIALLLAADARWLGGWLGWNAAGDSYERSAAWSRSSATLAGGVGGAQVALAAVAHASGALTPPLLAAAIFAAPTIELARPLRRRLARALDAGEPIVTTDG